MAKIARPRLAAIAWISALLHSEVYFLIKSTNLGFLDLLQVKTEMRGHKLLCNEVGHFSFKNTTRLPPRIISEPRDIASTQLASRHDRRPEAMALTMQAGIAFPNHNFYEQLNFGPDQLALFKCVGQGILHLQISYTRTIERHRRQLSHQFQARRRLRSIC